MDLNAKTILDHKLVAAVNLIWAIYHIWIAITIEQDNFFLAIVIIFVLLFIVALRAKENIARNSSKYFSYNRRTLFLSSFWRGYTYSDVK